jgi:carbonic anhydrase
LDNLRTHPSVAARVRQGKLALHGWYYDIPTGQVLAYDAARGGFAPLAAPAGVEELLAVAA